MLWLPAGELDMYDSGITADAAGLEFALLAPGRKVVRPGTGLIRAPFRRALPAVAPIRKRVPIRAWQSHSWTKKVVVGGVQPALPAKVRILRRLNRHQG